MVFGDPFDQLHGLGIDGGEPSWIHDGPSLRWIGSLDIMTGPLEGIRVVELAGIGPGPFCGMMLADAGADVVLVERPTQGWLPGLCRRGRRSIVVDLKRPGAAGVVLDLVATADALIEGFRPGVAERLGVGPEECLARNPRLVYARLTGWGQQGPLASAAGHDICYIALTGALHAVGREGERPVPPLNLVADYGGGGMLAAFGVLAGILQARSTGKGQVVDVAMVDGAALLMEPIYELFALGWWQDRRGVNLLDGGAPFYDTYETSDGKAVAVGPLEPEFYGELLDRLGLSDAELPPQFDSETWPHIRSVLARVFSSRTRDEWEEVFAGSDACVAPVLGLGEAPDHPHNRARGTFVSVGGMVQPGPAPRFGAHPRNVPAAPPEPGSHTAEILAELGYDRATIDRLAEEGIVRPKEGRS